MLERFVVMPSTTVWPERWCDCPLGIDVAEAHAIRGARERTPSRSLAEVEVALKAGDLARVTSTRLRGGGGNRLEGHALACEH